MLLTKNAKVWIACRDVTKGKAAVEDLKECTGRQAHFLKLNLANLQSIKAAAEEFMRCAPLFSRQHNMFTSMRQ